VNNSGQDWGAIFDWDGVVIDSSAHHERAWEIVSERENLPLPENHFQLTFGKRNQDSIPSILKWADDPDEVARLAYEKERTYREQVRKEGIRFLPGVHEWLEQLDRAGIPRAIGTSAPLENVEIVFEITGRGDAFDHIVSAEDVQRGKPDPEVFLQAAQRLNRKPEQCVVFEDAPMGIEAAIAGNMKTVAVMGTHERSAFPAVNAIVDQLDELDIDELGAWF
jgi:beta-phosphoglucomutase family hydrolase